MTTLIRRKHTIQTNKRAVRKGSGGTYEIDVDYALEMGLKLSDRLRRVFNTLYLAKEQTPTGWISDSAIVRIGWNYNTEHVSDAIVRVTVSRLRGELKGTGWWIENANGGMYRLVTVDPSEPPKLRHTGHRPGTGSKPGPNHPWRMRR